MLVHRALMADGAPQEWTVAVVPGSGSGELAGLAGALTITIADGSTVTISVIPCPNSERPESPTSSQEAPR